LARPHTPIEFFDSQVDGDRRVDRRRSTGNKQIRQKGHVVGMNVSNLGAVRNPALAFINVKDTNRA
jgi:hypothetical protein